eukprot:GHVU01061220.1.p4 GENE.GHVU01061220.1~~GHVU01061220.1.p4  ORF type:complete len:118 (-),score=7.78 GHVU01061220.1:1397-1750(-)
MLRRQDPQRKASALLRMKGCPSHSLSLSLSFSPSIPPSLRVVRSDRSTIDPVAHTHTHTHTQTHTHKHTHTFTHTQRDTYMHKHTQMPGRTRRHTLADVRPAYVCSQNGSMLVPMRV